MWPQGKKKLLKNSNTFKMLESKEGSSQFVEMEADLISLEIV